MKAQTSSWRTSVERTLMNCCAHAATRKLRSRPGRVRMLQTQHVLRRQRKGARTAVRRRQRMGQRPAVRRNRGKHSSTLTPGVHQTVQSVVAACIPVLGRPATTSTSLGLRLMVLRGPENTKLGISRAVNAWHWGHVNQNAA